MKNRIILPVVFAAVLAAATSVRAQIVIENFSAFASPTTLFYGDWSSTGDPFVPELTPVGTFSQGVGAPGFYNFASATSLDSAYVERTFGSAVNLGVNNLLTLSLRLLRDNTAESLTVFLLDSSANTASATFQMIDFSADNFTSRTLAFTASAGFAADDVVAFRLSGNDPFADPFSGPVLSVAIDEISVNHLAVAAVPEPSTWALSGACALGLIISVRQRRRS